jgi:hypothetical protein
MPRAPNTHISFDADDPGDCKRAIGELKMVILKLYGAAAARGLFADATPSRREVKTDKNAFLLADYLFHSKSYGWSVKRCAKDFADTNKRLPREWRVGPSGSTSPDTMEKQLRRQIRRMDKDHGYREFIKDYAATRFLPIKAITACNDPLFQEFCLRRYPPGDILIRKCPGLKTFRN